MTGRVVWYMDLILYLEELIMSIMGGSGYTLNDYVPVVPDGECRHTDRSSIAWEHQAIYCGARDAVIMSIQYKYPAWYGRVD
jgi:hypothetical protein